MKQQPSPDVPNPADRRVAAWLASVRLGAPQVHRDIVVWPLFLPGEDGPAYRTLDEAVRLNQARVTEISESGSVPQLKVINGSSDPLLILDGEELIGAKQNRAVNVTLLLAAQSETLIPVSCTERGRWRKVSGAFHSSDVVMEMKIRQAKMRSVLESLKAGAGPKSDRAGVWDKIQALHSKASYQSPTSSMHDLFLARQAETRAALEAFSCQAGQHGLLVSIRGEVAGCDVLSRADAYSRLHHKLVRSYVLDALLEKPGQPVLDEGRARQFLDAGAQCEEETFPSVGLGESIRLQGLSIAGVALAHERSVIHVALFRLDQGGGFPGDTRRMGRLPRDLSGFFDGRATQAGQSGAREES